MYVVRHRAKGQWWRYFLTLSAAVSVAAGLAVSSNNSQAQSQGAAARPAVLYGVSDTTPPLRSLPPLPRVVGEVRTLPIKRLPGRVGSVGPSGPDPVLQGSFGEVSAAVPGTSFEGVPNVDAVLPPDTNGALGPDHYVQMVNLSFAIFDRSGTELIGPTSINTLWQGFGGACETSNDGDPIVLYDHLADRWLLAQFALPRFPIGPFYLCIAVSVGPDPTGAYHRYAYRFKKMPDYPKFGVWRDGYYVSFNQFKSGSLSWAGQGVAVFERDRMLAGLSARAVYFDLFRLDPNLGGMLPSSLEGPSPPAGTSNYYSEVDDDAWGYPADQLQIWEFHVDWSNTGSSTFTQTALLPTAAFDTNLCGYSRNCIPQPGGTRVDALSDRLMYRLQFRTFSTHDSLVVNHSVDVDGLDHAGIRWYELRNTASGWSIYQQGTYAPDFDHRWMGSVAMNQNGDIALGYSVSSDTTFPSVRFTGRLDTDPPGEMTQGEGEIIGGTGYQTHSSGRWGDYSSLVVDPIDDCTFWYTQEYYATVGSAPWQTRVGSFKLRECGTPTACSIDADCDDGNRCNGIETCQGGTCVADTPVNCDDGDACTTDQCDSSTGACVYDPVSCADANVCTTDTCDPLSGCDHSPISCDDNDACTADSCDTVTGCASSPIDCDDADACTADSCDPATGCVHTPIQGCQPGPVCGNGVCEGGGEDCITCPDDCGGSGKNNSKSCCGNGTCEGKKEINNCPVDCAG
ncbi:MAG: hypothetical protein ACE5I7_13840 [Candidatus Binatia bacterium]